MDHGGRLKWSSSPRLERVDWFNHLRLFGDAGEDVGERGLQVDIVELGGTDQRLDDGGALM